MKIRISEKAIQTFERAFGIVGLGVIGFMIHKLGPSRIAANLHAVSWGFFLIVFTRGFYYFFETLAWKLILSEEGRHISFFKLFRVLLEGESLNYITVTKIGGEPLKAYALKDQVNMAISAASVIVLKFCTLFGFWVAITLGFLLMFFNADVTPQIKHGAGLGMAAMTALIVSLYWAQKKGLFAPLSWLLKKFQARREWLSHQVMRLARLDERILHTHHAGSGRVVLAALLCSLTWVEDFFFIWIVLHFLHMREGWFVPIGIGTLSLLMNSLFFFIPWRAGAQEGTMVLSFTLLNLSEPVGLSVAILKRMRELVWVFAGLVLFSLEMMVTQTSPEIVDKQGHLHPRP